MMGHMFHQQQGNWNKCDNWGKKSLKILAKSYIKDVKMTKK